MGWSDLRADPDRQKRERFLTGTSLPWQIRRHQGKDTRRRDSEMMKYFSRNGFDHRFQRVQSAVRMGSIPILWRKWSPPSSLDTSTTGFLQKKIAARPFYVGVPES